MIFHGDLNYQGHGDLKRDLRPSFHLKFLSKCYTTQFAKTKTKQKRMLLPHFANCFLIYRLNKPTFMSKSEDIVLAQQNTHLQVKSLISA